MNKIELNSEQVIELKKSILEKISSFKQKSILVIGDVGIDEYIHGQVKRISPEAPVPVLNVKGSEHRLGLAANVAKNISHLGGDCTLLSVLGDDDNNKLIGKLCADNNIKTNFITDTTRPTTIKTRVLHGAHHIVRIDKELKEFISQDIETKLLAAFESVVNHFDVVVVEDYNKGVVTESLCQSIIATCKKNNKPVLIDPHLTTPASFYKGADLLKPNINEVYALLKISQNSIIDKDQNHFTLAQRLKTELNLNQVLLTLGKEGMAIFENDQLTHIPTLAKHVYDVTGAGDTVIAVLALSRASGMSLVESSYLGNIAAGRVVSKVGTVSCEYDELIEQLT